MANYYEILGVPVSASQAQIRDAFRQRAGVIHAASSSNGSSPAGGSDEPADPGTHVTRNPANDAPLVPAHESQHDAREQMDQLSEALRVLSDPMRRRTYDSAVLPAATREHNLDTTHRARANTSARAGMPAARSDATTSPSTATGATNSASASAPTGAPPQFKGLQRGTQSPQYAGAERRGQSREFAGPERRGQPPGRLGSQAGAGMSQMQWTIEQQNGHQRDVWSTEKREALRASCAFCGSTPTVESTLSMITNPFSWWRFYVFTIGIIVIPLVLSMDPQIGLYRWYLLLLPFLAAWPVRRSKVARMCRTCGLATFRKVTNRTLLTGWWGVTPMFMNIAILAQNLFSLHQINRLDAPRRNPEFLSSHLAPLAPGKPMLLRGGIWVSIVACVVIGFAVFLLVNATSISSVP
ncbi:MAG: J domain-containing protein [Acidimicrobiales bacterium]